jgi:hypothetical protein
MLPMATVDDGCGSGWTGRETGFFEVVYGFTGRLRPCSFRAEFSAYDAAKAFYDSLDESAALWDSTGLSELCECKSLVA